MIEKGWIPDTLPPDAKDIKLKYDLDTNAHAVRWVGTGLDTATCRPTAAENAKKDIDSTPVARTLFEGLQPENPADCGEYFYAESGDKKLLWASR